PLHDARDAPAERLSADHLVPSFADINRIRKQRPANTSLKLIGLVRPRHRTFATRLSYLQRLGLHILLLHMPPLAGEVDLSEFLKQVRTRQRALIPFDRAHDRAGVRLRVGSQWILFFGFVRSVLGRSQSPRKRQRVEDDFRRLTFAIALILNLNRPTR